MRSVHTYTRCLIALACLLFSHASVAAPVSGTTAKQQSNTLTAQTDSKRAQAVAKKRSNLMRPTSMNLTIDKSIPLTFNRPAATIFIANPKIADVQVLSATSVMVFGKQTGQTTLIITDDYGNKIVYRSIVVSQNLSALRRALRTVIPNSKISAKSIPNGIVLTGKAADSSEVEDARRLAARYLPQRGGEIINRIKVAANNQVQILVRFAEVSKDVDKRFGFNWETVGRMGQFGSILATGADFYTPGEALARTVVGDSTNDLLSLSFNNGNYSVNGMIDALAKEGFVNILAEPSLTALSGQTASFLAGGEFPIPVPQSAETISIEWKQYGVSLAFTPTIINGNRINLHVRPEVSQLSDVGSIKLSNITIPSLITRRAETTLELNSGQSFALAGLLNNQQTQSIEKFPFLGDIPILGTLFRSTRFQNNESELVIIITPVIVKPTTENKLSLPTDGIIAPTDEELFFEQKNIGSNRKARMISGQPRAVILDNPKSQGKAKALKAKAIPMKAAKRVPVEKKKLAIKKVKTPTVKKVTKPKAVIKSKTAPLPKKKPVIEKKRQPAVIKKSKQSFPMTKSVPSKIKTPVGGFIVE